MILQLFTTDSILCSISILLLKLTLPFFDLDGRIIPPAVCIISIVGITINIKLSVYRYLSLMPCDKEHIKRLLHIAPLEFHHREDLPQPPSLVATVLSRSTFDLTEVSLSLLPVIAFIECAFQCLSPEDI